MVISEKRKYRRLPIKLDLSCRKVESTCKSFHTGYTVNVSPGGVYFKTTTDTFRAGNLLKVELLIPPKTGLLESGGRISGLGRILRIHPTASSGTEPNQSSVISGVAVEFCKALKLCI